jgi:hypothetical protein
MPNGFETFDWLSPIYPNINSLIFGTVRDDVLSAQPTAIFSWARRR